MLVRYQLPNGEKYFEILEALGGVGVIIRPWESIIKEKDYYNLLNFFDLLITY